MSLLFAFPAMQETPPLIPFSTNKYMSMSEMSSNSIPVILSIASQLNPRLL